jgi:hypothetical protein
MDDNTRQVLVAIATAFGALATGVVVARIGFSYARRSERDRWQREDARRWVDRRREVCVAVASSAMGLQQMAVSHRAGRKVKLDDYFPELKSSFASVAELRLISEHLADTGGDLMIAANTLVITAVTTKDPITEPAAQFDRALGAFMAAARADIQG